MRVLRGSGGKADAGMNRGALDFLIPDAVAGMPAWAMVSILLVAFVVLWFSRWNRRGQ